MAPDMSDSDNHEEEDGNEVKRNQEAPDLKVSAVLVPLPGAGKHRRKVVVTILVIALVVGGSVWAWMKYWRQPSPPQALCDGRISSQEITRYLNATADSSTTDNGYYDCYISFPDTSDVGMMGIFVRDDGRIKLGSISGAELDESEVVSRNEKDGVVTQLETYGLDGNAYSWTNNSGYFVYALWYRPDGVTVTLAIGPQDDDNQNIASNAQLAGLISYMGPALLSGSISPTEEPTGK